MSACSFRCAAAVGGAGAGSVMFSARSVAVDRRPSHVQLFCDFGHPGQGVPRVIVLWGHQGHDCDGARPGSGPFLPRLP